MRKIYEAPELKLIGEATEVVMGSDGFTTEGSFQMALDFEFQEDEL